MKDLILYGASYPDVIKLIQAINEVYPTWKVKGFIDDTPEKKETTFMGYPVLGDMEYICKENEETFYFNNVYSTMKNRKKVADVLDHHKCKLAKLIHPAVDITYAKIGEGTIIPHGVILGANVIIGRHCAIRYNALVNHDSVIEDYVFVGPGVNLSGYVTLKSGCYIGVASVVKERVTIGVNSVVGAGAVVLRDVLPDQTVVGLPAKNIGEVPNAKD